MMVLAWIMEIHKIHKFDSNAMATSVDEQATTAAAAKAKAAVTITTKTLQEQSPNDCTI